jgi:hypothetical protein
VKGSELPIVDCRLTVIRTAAAGMNVMRQLSIEEGESGFGVPAG